MSGRDYYGNGRGGDDRGSGRRPRDDYERDQGYGYERSTYQRTDYQGRPGDRDYGSNRDPYNGGGRGGGGGGGGNGGGYGGGVYGPAGGAGGGGGGGRGFDQGGRGGGGGRGKRPHMGENSAIINMVRGAAECSDARVLEVIAPPLQDQLNREALIRESGSGDCFLPPPSSWRSHLTAGLLLNGADHRVYANHYLLDVQRLPKNIFQYSVSIYGYDRTGRLREADISKEGSEQKVNVLLLKTLLGQREKEWIEPGTGVSYDGGSSLITSKPLRCLQGSTVEDDRRVVEDVLHPDDQSSKFSVGIMLVANIVLPEKSKNAAGATVISGETWLEKTFRPSIQALDIALLSFARWQAGDANPGWIISGPKTFKVGGTEFQLTPAFKAMLGYYSSLKAVKAGLVLVSDISVTSFMTGGPLIDVMAALGGYRGVQDMERESRDLARQTSSGLDPMKLARIRDVLKGCKIQVLHLGRMKKFKDFGFAANSRDSKFAVENGEMVSVAEYYAMRVLEGDPRYSRFLAQQRGLKYPYFPTINTGTERKPVLVPVELVVIPPGQTRQRNCDKEISSKIIKHAAMLPDDRMKYLAAAGQTLMGAIKSDQVVAAFGLGGVNGNPMRLHATILCPAKLQYGNRLIEPMLTGTWNMTPNVQFSHPAPVPAVANDGSNTYPYDVLIVHGGREPRGWESAVSNFLRNLEGESRVVSLPLRRLSQQPRLSSNHSGELHDSFVHCKERGAAIVLVIMIQDFYNAVKLSADTVGMTTQCVKFSNVEKTPRGMMTNVLMKLNMKLGGINHTLATRGNPAATAAQEGSSSTQQQPVFQKPPQSISWMFNEPCMVVGVDISIPNSKGSEPSVAAIVASMDGMLGQYACYVAACASGSEPAGILETAMHQLLMAFAHRNRGQYPKRVIFYRVGVADNQFPEIMDKEIPAFKEAIKLCGMLEDSVKMSVVVCQKKHHTRLVYQQTAGGEYMNPCVGLCVDGTDSTASNGDALHSICSPVINDFYLNSHLAVLGTSKPTKYSLIHDEIGFKNAELQLLTYWTTHLYGRCTRAVSFATPAYYAHWAARRGKTILAGATPAELKNLTERWLNPESGNGDTIMYFI